MGNGVTPWCFPNPLHDIVFIPNLRYVGPLSEGLIEVRHPSRPGRANSAPVGLGAKGASKQCSIVDETKRVRGKAVRLDFPLLAPHKAKKCSMTDIGAESGRRRARIKRMSGQNQAHVIGSHETGERDVKEHPGEMTRDR